MHAGGLYACMHACMQEDCMYACMYAGGLYACRSLVTWRAPTACLNGACRCVIHLLQCLAASKAGQAGTGLHQPLPHCYT
jgi:hypothetical protein